MKISYEVTATKAELETIKGLAVTVAKEFGQDMDRSELDQKFSHKVRMKASGGNFLTMINLNDSYECVVEMEISEEIFTEIADTIVELVPMFAGIVKTMTKFESRLNEMFTPEEIEIDGKMQDVA